MLPNISGTRLLPKPQSLEVCKEENFKGFLYFYPLAPGFWAQAQPELAWSKPSKKVRMTKVT